MNFTKVMGTTTTPHMGVIELFEYHINMAQVAFLKYAGTFHFTIFDDLEPETGPFVEMYFAGGARLFVNAMPTELIARGRS